MSGMQCVPEIDPTTFLTSAPPPSVGDASTAGISTVAARSDHTHLSSVFKAIKATTDATGQVSWTYPTGFFAVSPVITLTVETSAGQPMVSLLTSNTAAGGAATLLRAQMLPATILSLTALASFNVYAGTVPVGTKLHIFAAKPTVIP